MADKNPSVGEILRQARQEQKLSLEDVSQVTMIREKYLAAIEADNWDVLPSIVQQKGFVRSYARVVGLDPNPLLQQLRPLIPEKDLEAEQEVDGDENSPDLERPAPQPPEIQEIGQALKKQRERLAITIANVSEQIFIPVRYLEAIEQGRLEELPSTVQGKGMVKNYAEFLGLDPDPLLLNYAEVLQRRLEVDQKGLPDSRSRAPILIWFRRFLANPTLLWAAVLALIFLVTIWAGALIFGGGQAAADETATIPAVADILLPTGTATATLEIPQVTPGEFDVDVSPTAGALVEGEGNLEITPTPGLTGNEKVQVQLVILQRTWVRVTVDNILAFEGRLLPGSVQLFGGELSIEVLTGNAAGVEVIFNQRDLGVMGLYGQVVSRVFTPEGVATPTPTITLTPTPSDTPEPSLTPTATLSGEED